MCVYPYIRGQRHLSDRGSKNDGTNSNVSRHSLPMGVGNDKQVDRKNKASSDCSVNVFGDPSGRKMVERSWVLNPQTAIKKNRTKKIYCEGDTERNFEGAVCSNGLWSGMRSHMWKSPRKWRKCNLVSGDCLCGQRHELAMNWVDRPRTSADERMLCRRRTVVIVWWAVAGFGRFSLTSRFSWTVTLIILGLGFLRARLLRLCCTAAFPPIFLQLRKGPLWSCAELFQSGALCCIDQCGTVKPRPPKMRGPRTVLEYVGKRG